MGVNSLPKTVTRQRRNCDLNPGPSAPESSTLTTRLPSHSGHLLVLFKMQPLCPACFCFYANNDDDVHDAAGCTNGL